MKRITTIASALAATWFMSCSTKESAQQEVRQPDTTASLARSAAKASDYQAAQHDSVARAYMAEVARLLYDRDMYPEEEIADRIQQLHQEEMAFIRDEHRILVDDSSQYRLCQVRVGHIFNTAAYHDAAILLYEHFTPHLVLYNDSTKVFRFVPGDIKLLTVSRTQASDDPRPYEVPEETDDFFNHRVPASIELENGVISVELWGGAKFTSVYLTYDKRKDILRSKEVFVYDEHD